VDELGVVPRRRADEAQSGRSSRRSWAMGAALRRRGDLPAPESSSSRTSLERSL
jgi:hypothetical protein